LSPHENVYSNHFFVMRYHSTSIALPARALSTATIDESSISWHVSMLYASDCSSCGDGDGDGDGDGPESPNLPKSNV